MKVLVDVFVPAISEHFDVQVPVFLTIEEVTVLVAEAVEELSEHNYVSSKNEFLCFAEQNALLKKENTLRDYGVRNGDHLLLI